MFGLAELCPALLCVHNGRSLGWLLAHFLHQEQECCLQWRRCSSGYDSLARSRAQQNRLGPGVGLRAVGPKGALEVVACEMVACRVIGIYALGV
jgi:hypothetical protein